MGIWDWIVEKLTEGAPAYSRPASTPGADSAEPSGEGEGVAVATLDPDMESVSQDGPREAQTWWAPQGATVLEPPEPVCPDLTTEARALSNLLVSHFDGHDLKMPPLLHLAERVLSQLRHGKKGMDAIAKTIVEDQVIVAAVLRMANSPLYRGLHKITAIQPALTRLGVRAIRMLMMHESLHSAMFQGKGWSAELARIIWIRSLAGACVMRGLSKFTAIDKEEAHLIGLLHDIGNVIVLRVAHDDQIFTHYDMDLETFDHLCFQCHLEFGELIADAWKLPEGLKALICNHHSYPAPDDPLRTERLQLQLTDMIVSMLEYTPFVPYDLLNTRVVCDLGLAKRGGFTNFLEKLPDEVTATVEAL
ncbi:MAG: HDOD domain-containing protein [Planctomycetota bacterium]|jgi:HD-like signal output (HDOD) protein